MPVRLLVALLIFMGGLSRLAGAQAPANPPAAAASAQPSSAPSAQAGAQALPEPSPTASPSRAFDLSAKRVTYYSDRSVVGADGNVLVTLADGTRISGNTFAMDLKLNRFILAGDVHVRTTAGQDIAGAAFSEFFDFDRAYFVPLIALPDRWTFIGSDFAHPLRGREMPGDTFFLPDLSNEHVFLYGSKARVTPRESVRFTPAFINLNFLTNRPAAYAPTPGYILNFSANPNFAQNGLAGAYFDAPYPFQGGAHSLGTAHLRYDEINHFYLAYEQHLAITDRSYLVLSANPLTRPQKSYNLLGMYHFSPKVQSELFVQENAFQYGFSQPLAAGAFAQLKTTVGLRQSWLQWNLDGLWQSLLAQPAPVLNPVTGATLYYYGAPEHNWVPDHGTDSQISWTSFDHHISKYLPFTYRLRSGIGFVHDSYAPPQSLEGVNYPTIWQHFVGFTLQTPSVILKSPNFRDVHLNAVFDKQRQWFSAPHHVDVTTTTLSASKTFDKHFTGFVNYSIVNTGDYYGPLQTLVYPPQVPVSPITGESYPGYAAFSGFGTTRSLSTSAIWTPSSSVTLNVTWRVNHDFPGPIPYLPGPLGFGQTLGYQQQADIGVSPQQFTADLRMRVRPNLLIDLGRSYYFNWGNRRWDPQFTILISK